MAPAVAILVVVGLGAVGAEPCIATRSTGGRIEHLVVAPVRAAQQAPIDTQAGRIEARRIAFEAHRTGGCTRPPQYGLRSLHHYQPVVGFRRHVGQRVVHARRARAGHAAIVGQQVQARAEHAAQDRIAVGAAVAQGGESRNGLQVVGAVAGRNGLARQGRVGLVGQRRDGCSGDDHAIERGGIGGGVGVRNGRRRACEGDRDGEGTAKEARMHERLR